MQIVSKGIAAAAKLLAQWNANKLQGFDISTATPAGTNVLVYNSTTSKWEPQSRGQTEVSATADTTTTSGTDGLMNSMQIVNPAAGDYLVFFSTSVECSANGATVSAGIYVGGSQVTHTDRTSIPFITGVVIGNATTIQTISSQCKATVNGSQNIEVRWRRSSGTGTAHQRTLNILKVG